MFAWSKNRKSNKSGGILLEDLSGNPLREGDIVESLRYDLGISKIIVDEGEWFYVSEKTGERVSYVRMIDAATKRQKVHKK